MLVGIAPDRGMGRAELACPLQRGGQHGQVVDGFVHQTIAQQAHRQPGIGIGYEPELLCQMDFL
jgi:hypothetical protein